MLHRKLVLILLLVVFSCSILLTTTEAIAQGPEKGEISIVESAFSTKYYRDNSRVHNPELQQLLNIVPEAKAEYNSGRSMRVAGNILGVIGGFLIGWPIGQKIGGEESPNWTMAAVGGAIIIPGFILESKGKNKIINAINTYNDSIGENHSTLNNSLNIGLCNRGMYLIYSF